MKTSSNASARNSSKVACYFALIVTQQPNGRKRNESKRMKKKKRKNTTRDQFCFVMMVAICPVEGQSDVIFANWSVATDLADRRECVCRCVLIRCISQRLKLSARFFFRAFSFCRARAGRRELRERALNLLGGIT